MCILTGKGWRFLFNTLVASFIFFFTLSSTFADSKSQQFATWTGLGPDKWASIWLIQRYISPGTRVKFIGKDADVEEIITFDIPSSRYMRTAQASTYESLRLGFNVSDSKSEFVNRVIHDIDINTWTPDVLQISSVVEQGYRSLQEVYNRDRVPYQCYMAFFDKVASLHHLSEEEYKKVSVQSLMPESQCGHAGIQQSDANAFVQQIPIEDVLDLIRSNKKVVFVDVREPEEFKEVRIPTAVNLPIRDLSADTVKPLLSADVVVSYCIKDFRGFEMAKKLKQMGVEHSVILKPFGLKGWINSGLPVAEGDEPENDTFARSKLIACIDRDASCLDGVEKGLEI